ncbi:conserved hypothetical protein [Microbacterium sp. C448]|uniref:polyphosphate polymerase domain-containing protein n=1 Tax=Microbacterium sp. C448 TaxID=1177594 RepID=UPI0003DE69B5|nr:polyphosphate polymerase domain-containing protein [Microbacterium sp. C448]CDK00622.1 conserved hypothetical protein [Microbacterium sp. C448]
MAGSDALTRFEEIGLDELVAEASLMTRVDRKYVVPRAALPAILAGLDDDTRVLEIGGERRFGYHSVYFDTPDLLSFRMAARPRRRRFKVRTRRYMEVGTAYLEIKTRGARGATVKERTEYPPAAAELLTRGARTDVASALEAVGVEPDLVTELAPTLATRYRRATLLAADSVARATVDTDLEWIEADGRALRLPHLAIVETKSGSAASDVDRLLWRLGHRPTSVSKYATGLAALRPELPRNRWARLLRDSFA